MLKTITTIIIDKIHCVREKSKSQTIFDENVKSQCILTKLFAIDSEYIFERTAKFC